MQPNAKNWSLLHRDGDTLTIFRCPWFGFHIQWVKPDTELHTHPWPFLGAVVDGAYTEAAGKLEATSVVVTHYNTITFLTYKKSDQLHRTAAGAATLFLLSGPVRNCNWSFWSDKTHIQYR